MAKNDIHFWSGGVSWNNISKSKLEEFKTNHYWQIGWDKNSTSQGAKQAWENIKKVKPNDFLAFHGYGGKNDLTIYQISKIIKKDEEKGILYLQQLSEDNAQLFHNKAPKMEQGGWFGTLFQVTGNDAINAIFGNYLKTNNKQMQEIQQLTNLLAHKKNIILQGAPGVGKTYTTAALALSICGETIPSDHEEVMNHYEELQKEGRIGFVTFHQSLDYEDFVEGIKPQIINEDKMIYKVEDGIFKQISLRAKPISNSLKNEAIDFSRTKVFKMTINDDQVFNYCFNNKVIALCPYKNDPQNEEDFKTTQTAALQRFNEWMEVGDIVLITKNLTEVRAIAKITSQAHFEDSMSIGLCQIRSVEWLYNDSLHISKICNNPYFGTQRIYGFYRDAKYGTPSFNSDNIKTDVLNNIINGTYNDDSQPYVLIIDEINRGNVSKIFGELITLLEADKRIGGNHPLKVTLPYSKTEFGVPSNLYIIGTMNTTDRSVGNIDYAVRRRFAFVTLKSDKEVVKQKSIPQALELFEAVETFIKKNQIEMDFEDLMVGHSYFIAENEPELKMKWDYEIIPLLREYYKDGLLKQDVTPETTIPQFVGTWRAASLPNQPTETQSAASTQTI